MSAAAKQAAPGLSGWLDGFLRAPGFLRKYPYYAAVLARFEPVADPSVRGLAVSLHGGRFYLHVNVDSFVATPQHLTGMLLHEVHHVVLGHLSHERFRDVTSPRIMELAMEMSANEYIEEPLPDPPLGPRIEWQLFKRQGLRAGQSTMERYRLLLEVDPSGTIGETTVDDHRPWHKGPPHPGAVEQARRLLQEAIEEVGTQQGPQDPTVLARYLLAGRRPGGLLEELGGAAGPPETFVDWKAALALFVARSRAPMHTYGRPNRRFPGRVGEVPGRAYSPRVVVHPSLLVAIDTSMSMTRDELGEVARQLMLLRGAARITVAECDTQVTRVYAFEGSLHNISGRGGTDLRPIFSSETLRAMRPDGVVYFTDGQGPHDERPPAVPTLWVLSKPAQFHCPWGARAHMLRKPPRR